MDDILRALPSAGMINGRPSGSPATGSNAVAASKERDRLDKACGDFEAIFVQQLFKTMRASVPESELFNGGRAEEIYTSMLDQQVASIQSVISKLANRLQRKLMAKQTRSWEFNLEEGLLDTARLDRVVLNPMNALSFKLESDTEFRDTVVTLLIDNSGSMRGRPISTAAI